MNIQRIHTPSGEELVVLSAADFDRLVADREDDIDIADARAAMAEMESDGAVPGAVLNAIIAGGHPLTVWRKFRGMSQAELATRVEMTQAAIARLESAAPGSGRPETRRVLAKALEAPLSSFDPAEPAGEVVQVRRRQSATPAKRPATKRA